MNGHLEHIDEIITQALQDAELLQASVKATITKMQIYLKKQQQQISRRQMDISFAQDGVPDRMLNRQSNQAENCIEYFNTMFRSLEGQLVNLRNMIPTNSTITVDDEPIKQARIQAPVQLQQPKPVPNQMPVQVPMPAQNQQIYRDRKQNDKEKPFNNYHLTSYHRKELQESSQQDNKSNQDSRSINFDCRLFEPTIRRSTRAIRMPDNLPALQFGQKLQSKSELTVGRLKEFLYDSLKYPISTETTQLCELCGLKENPVKFGHLLLVPSFRMKGKTYPIHEMCALWSQNLVFHTDDGQIDPKNIDYEIDRAQSTSCRQCYRTGASVTCGKCDESYHFQCIMNTDKGSICPDDFIVLCQKHKYKKPPKQKPNPLNKLIKKKPKKQQYQQQESLTSSIDQQIEESSKSRKLTRIVEDSLDEESQSSIKLEQ